MGVVLDDFGMGWEIGIGVAGDSVNVMGRA